MLSESCQQCSKSRQLGKNFTTASIKVLTPCDTHDQIIFNQYTEGKEMGCFRMLFKGSHIFLKFSSYFTRFNYRICRGGDQSLYISKNLVLQIL